MKLRCIDNNLVESELKLGGIYEGELKEYPNGAKRYILKNLPNEIYYTDRFEIIDQEEIKEKTFGKIIAEGIKEGEVWEDENFTLELSYDGDIRLSHKDGYLDCCAIHIDVNSIFKLKRKEYNFEEAFKAYENNKEIESYDGTKYKKIDGEDHILTHGAWWSTFNNGVSFTVKQIRDRWYIND